MRRMETPMKKPSKGVKSRRNHPYANDVPLHFKKESAEKHPGGKVTIHGIPQVAQEPKSKKNWSKKKNSKNLTLDIPPPSQTVEEWKEFWKQRVEACKAQDEPVKQEPVIPEPVYDPLTQLANAVVSIVSDVQQQPIQQQPI